MISTNIYQIHQIIKKIANTVNLKEFNSQNLKFKIKLQIKKHNLISSFQIIRKIKIITLIKAKKN